MRRYERRPEMRIDGGIYLRLFERQALKLAKGRRGAGPLGEPTEA